MSRFILPFIPVLLGFCVYAFFCIRKALRFWKSKMSKRNSVLITLGILACLVVLCIFTWRITLILLLYWLAFTAAVDLLAFIIARFRKLLAKDAPWKNWKIKVRKVFRTRLIPVFLAILLTGYGILNLANLRENKYTVTSALVREPLRVFLLTDIHFDTIQSKQEVFDCLDAIADEQPDLLLLGGDMTDEGTSAESMHELFEHIGKVQTTYGIFYVSGNHDKQAYSRNKAFTEEEYEAVLQQNNIRHLSDEIFETDTFILIGRNDASNRNRLPGNTFLENWEHDKYVILLEHQPNSSTKEDWKDADLVLCGHTHNGQVFPAGCLIEAFGYSGGMYREGNRTLIVSAGVAGWGFKLKTQGKAEYVRIDIQPES